MELKTKRLRLVPLSAEQMALLCEGRDKQNKAMSLSSDEGNLHAKYCELHRQCRAHPENMLWYTCWQITLKNETKSIGIIGFCGPANDRHEIEVHYEPLINEQDPNEAAEALKAFCDWAFSKEIYFVRIKSEPGDETFQKVLEQCGFKQAGNEDGKLLFELEKPQTAWMSIYMCLGMSVGLSIGLSLDQMAVGLCLGLSVGLFLGLALDADDRKKRKRD